MIEIQRLSEFVGSLSQRLIECLEIAGALLSRVLRARYDQGQAACLFAETDNAYRAVESRILRGE